MRTNVRKKIAPVFTHEGGKAVNVNAELQLRRSVLTNMLFEDNFYENGEDVATRIKNLIPKVPADVVANIAIEARTEQKLRHVPLLLAREMARLDSHKSVVANVLENIVQRPDELSEFVSLYWKEKKQPLSKQVKKGLGNAFKKFNAFSLGRYQDTGAIKLRDVLFLTHPKPNDSEQEKLWKDLVDGKLTYPTNTWEVQISAAGANKKAAWTNLLLENSLGALALLRNLRNCREAGVDDDVIRAALKNCNPEKVLPFRFITAAKYAPNFEPELEALMFKCLHGKEILSGKTALLLDVSGSMIHTISSKSELTRFDAACALAMFLREICETVDVYTFSRELVQVPARHGFALKDAILKSQAHRDTFLAPAVKAINSKNYDRLICLSDEQVADNVPAPTALRSYMINVASMTNGIGYRQWLHIDGWSESIADYIIEYEKFE